MHKWIPWLRDNGSIAQQSVILHFHRTMTAWKIKVMDKVQVHLLPAQKRNSKYFCIWMELISQAKPSFYWPSPNITMPSNIDSPNTQIIRTNQINTEGKGIWQLKAERSIILTITIITSTQNIHTHSQRLSRWQPSINLTWIWIF